MSASLPPTDMQVEQQIDLLSRRRSQESVAQAIHCDQAQISRKASRVLAGDAAWLEVLRAHQLLALARSDQLVRAAVAAAINGRDESGDAAAIHADMDERIDGAAGLQRAYHRAMADHVLTAREIDVLLAKAQAEREGLQRMIRDLIAARKGAPR